MSFSFVDSDKSAKIKVIGVGGAGSNAVNNMIAANLHGVKFIVANTDAQALENSRAEVKLQIGGKLTEGLGAGANPELGKQAALENVDAIRTAIQDSHMVFITAGLGGGTGTGAAPVVAQICKELEILTVAVVTRPFSFEGKKRARQADLGLEELRKHTDTVITIPNDRLRSIAEKKATMIDMFRKADEILHHSVKGITDLIMMPGLVNLDFADVRTTMRRAGLALMGIGIASGENRAREAAQKAIAHPLLEDISIRGAKGVLMNITSGPDLTLDEMTEASDFIHDQVGEDAEIIWGQAIDEEIGNEMRITVIATGIGDTVEAPPVDLPKRTLDSIEKRGKVRDLTLNELELNTGTLDEPAYVRHNISVGNTQGTPVGSAAPGLTINTEEDLDIPTFLRKKAD
ncbi:cell division protein FtsZ [Desulfoluna limicola]|uniref:Cell division protein FtsZ n=1 Tax=Desulfoluna limicola TaxID=2810562 RepID=A0ABN6EZ04_9BACT|nr:cell division protein FtsZ [Desulfoluna limicola]BCS94457.1 cell division protein FtsZ [Desulfoluna limicola]